MNQTLIVCGPVSIPGSEHLKSPRRIIAFLEDPPVAEKILRHIGEPTQAPEVLPARAPPQGELGFDQAGSGDETWD